MADRVSPSAGAALHDLAHEADEAHHADAGEALTIHPADPSHPCVADLMARAARLTPAGTQDAAPDLPLVGDHTANPSLAKETEAVAAGARPAAVLIAIGTDAAGTLSVILTERAGHLAKHAGQVALPGGKLERGETPTIAALREAHEEVALPPAAVHPLAMTEQYLTRTGFVVVPVIGLVTRRTVLRPDPGEVAEAFLAPLSRVLDAAHRRERQMEWKGRPRTVYEVMVGDKRVWGVTAGIFKLVSERLYER